MSFANNKVIWDLLVSGLRKWSSVPKLTYYLERWTCFHPEERGQCQ